MLRIGKTGFVKFRKTVRSLIRNEKVDSSIPSIGTKNIAGIYSSKYLSLTAGLTPADRKTSKLRLICLGFLFIDCT